MGKHARAWDGLRILVFGSTPTVPMNIEQAIAEASPENEVRIESFEDYDDALNFCKQNKDVGFAFVLENCGNTRAVDVVKNLAAPYESRGLPFFACLLYEKQKTIQGLEALNEVSHLLAYKPTSDILDSTKVGATLEELWGFYISKVESEFVPERLEESIVHLACEPLGEDGVHFIDRVSALLSSKLNISWLDSIAIHWIPMVSAIDQSKRTFLETHSDLLALLSIESFMPLLDQSLLQIASSSASLRFRIPAAASILNKSRKQGDLSKLISEVRAIAKPGTPALLRTISSFSDKILEIAGEESKLVKKAA